MQGQHIDLSRQSKSWVTVCVRVCPTSKRVSYKENLRETVVTHSHPCNSQDPESPIADATVQGWQAGCGEEKGKATFRVQGPCVLCLQRQDKPSRMHGEVWTGRCRGAM
jgi:hypothetical protein